MRKALRLIKIFSLGIAIGLGVYTTLLLFCLLVAYIYFTVINYVPWYLTGAITTSLLTGSTMVIIAKK